MGHAFAIEAEVQTGDRRGALSALPPPICRLMIMCCQNSASMRCALTFWTVICRTGTARVANLGLRPTVGTDKPRLESHFFDFDGDLYGANLRVSLLHFIRPNRNLTASTR